MENKKVEKVVRKSLENILQVLQDEGVIDKHVYAYIDFEGVEYVLIFGKKELFKDWQK